MKIRTFLLIATTLTVSMMKAQDYQIQKVEPDTLFTGENLISIILNKELVDYDSIIVHIKGTSWNSECSGDDISWTDSIITARILVSGTALNQEGELTVDLINTTDWSYEIVDYADPIYVASGISPQGVRIQSVVPMNLIPGEDNEIIVTLNKEKGSEDSAFVSVYAYLNGSLTDVYYPASNDPADGLLTWNDSTVKAIIAIPDLSEIEIGIVHVEMINKKYWIGYDILYEDTLTIGGSIHSLEPEICMVSVDSSNKNIVVWEPEYPDYVDSIFIYKETAAADEFEIIGKLTIDNPSVFIDEESENAPNSNRYCIAFHDTTGILSKISSPHKTLHLTMNVGLNGAINLIWEKYEGFDYSTFFIYRGSSKGGMMKIAEIPSNLFTFTDLSPSLFHLFYQVVIEHPSPCDISMQKSSQTIFSSTKSNFVEYTVVSNELLEDSEYTINIYPNPVSDYLTINIQNSPVEAFTIEILDLSGRSVRNYSSINNGSQIELSTLKSGMYILKVNYNNDASQNKLFVKE